jgi:endogenous inhibitor of DNA gyrase (YacG/DUF329 family)
MNDLIKLVKSQLFTRTEKLCSPRISSKKYNYIIKQVEQQTSYLPNNASFSQRWWHLLNGEKLPICFCGNIIKWNNHSKFYPSYCSQHCATTSPEASERTRIQFKGSTVPKERAQQSKQTRIQRGYYKDKQATVEKLSVSKKGAKNPQYGKPSWNKGHTAHLSISFGKKFPGRGLTGNKNPQFGKPPSIKAGRGIKGKYKNIHFRSSLEMFYLLFWDKNNILFTTAETKEFRVKYTTQDGRERTYSPDFFLTESNTIVEIKPEKLHHNTEVLIKFKALKKEHPDKNCKIIGFTEISNFIKEIIVNNTIEHLIQTKQLELTTNQYQRLTKNYVDIIRATI